MNFLRDETGPMHGSVAGEFDTTTGLYSPTGSVAGEFDTTTGLYSPTAGIRLTWPGGGSTMPTDSAADSASGIQSQLIIALVLGGIMLGVLGLLGYLLFRNAERAKEFFIDFMSFEMLLALEVCLEVRCMAQCTAWRGSMWPSPGRMWAGRGYLRRLRLRCASASPSRQAVAAEPLHPVHHRFHTGGVGLAPERRRERAALRREAAHPREAYVGEKGVAALAWRRSGPGVSPSTAEYPGHGFRLAACRSRPSLRRIGK